MGEIAAMMIDGEVCELCGCFLDGDAPGHPRLPEVIRVNG